MEPMLEPKAAADSVLTLPLDAVSAPLVIVRAEENAYDAEITTDVSVPNVLSNRLSDWAELVNSVKPGPNVAVCVAVLMMAADAGCIMAATPSPATAIAFKYLIPAPPKLTPSYQSAPHDAAKSTLSRMRARKKSALIQTISGMEWNRAAGCVKNSDAPGGVLRTIIVMIAD
jgi:hypothetical protein